jgi:hypothetical protein
MLLPSSVQFGGQVCRQERVDVGDHREKSKTSWSVGVAVFKVGPSRQVRISSVRTTRRMRAELGKLR